MNTREHQCVTCPALGRDGQDDRPQPNTYEYRWTCDDCRAQLPGLLNRLPRLHTELDPTPSSNHTERVTGTTNTPLGVRIPVLDQLITGPATRIFLLPNGPDQDGHIPAQRLLHAITTDWWPTWHHTHPRETFPTNTTIPALAKWLHNRTDWACNTLEHTLPNHAHALNTLTHHLQILTAGAPDKPEPIKGIECRECSCYTLARHRGDIICTACRDRMTPDEYDRWTKLLAAAHSGK